MGLKLWWLWENLGGKTSIEQDSGNSPANCEQLVVLMPEGTVPIKEVEGYRRDAKGDFISNGASGIVERLPSGDVVKTPFPGPAAAACRRDITTEAQIYQRLGLHTCLVRMIDWDPEDCSLTMEHMPNGNLRDYLLANNDKISAAQRLKWAGEAAESLQLLHAADVIHCKVEPRNFLLDADLGLRIARFSGSSIESSKTSAAAAAAFSPPGPPGSDWSRPTIKRDLFGLGSTLYFIMTGQYPFPEPPSDEVGQPYKPHEFPNLANIPCRDIIRRCWHSDVGSAQEIYDYIQAMRIRLVLVENLL